VFRGKKGGETEKKKAEGKSPKEGKVREKKGFSAKRGTLLGYWRLGGVQKGNAFQENQLPVWEKSFSDGVGPSSAINRGI